MNIEHAFTVEGFMSSAEIVYLAQVSAKSRRICEIGSWKGRSSCAFAANTLGIVFCVDVWQGSLENDFRIEDPNNPFIYDFMSNTSRYGNLVMVRKPSLEAAQILGTFCLFDAIFIDAGHRYEACRADILAWRPLLKSGGILFGHDYGHFDWPGVKQAVDELVPNFSIVPETSIWTTEAL